jgi:hypothetical protein
MKNLKNLQLAHRLLDALKFESTLDRFGARTGGSSPDAAAIGRYRDFRAKYFDMPKLRDRAAARYAELFTEGELAELVRFFESPAGRKFTDQQPSIGEAIHPLIADVFREHADEYRRHVLGLP